MLKGVLSIKWRIASNTAGIHPTTRGHTMSAGYDKSIIAFHTTQEKRDYIKGRADYVGWSLSGYQEAINDYWFAQGAPKLHGRDKVLPVPKFKSKQELDQRKVRAHYSRK